LEFLPEDFSTLNLYMYGPQDPMETVTAVKLLDASTDRSARPHHYIDLKTDGEVDGNTITYELQAVSDEEPGTYTVSLWAVLAEDPRSRLSSSRTSRSVQQRWSPPWLRP
jgi:hypothetical protein